MTTDQFREELKELDSRLSVIQNPNRPQLCNIKLDGLDICPIPSGEIREEPDENYTMQMPNGWIIKHKSRREALALVNSVLEMIKTKEGQDNFYAR